MSEIYENPENPKTQEESTKVNGCTSSGELPREQMQEKMKKMSRKIASLEKKSARSKKAHNVTPTKLDFDGEGGKKEGETPKRRSIQKKRTGSTHQLLV